MVSQHIIEVDLQIHLAVISILKDLRDVHGQQDVKVVEEILLEIVQIPLRDCLLVLLFVVAHECYLFAVCLYLELLNAFLVGAVFAF